MTTQATTPRRPLKLEQALDMLINAYQRGRYVYAFDATNAYHDSCFHTTVSELVKKGIRFDKRPHEGTRHLDYKISPESLKAAYLLRNHYRIRRKLPPVFNLELSSLDITEQEAKALAFLVSAAKTDRYVSPTDAANAYGAVGFTRTVTALHGRGLVFRQQEEKDPGSLHLSAYQLAPESLGHAEHLLSVYGRSPMTYTEGAA